MDKSLYTVEIRKDGSLIKLTTNWVIKPWLPNKLFNWKSKTLWCRIVFTLSLMKIVEIEKIFMVMYSDGKTSFLLINKIYFPQLLIVKYCGLFRSESELYQPTWGFFFGSDLDWPSLDLGKDLASLISFILTTLLTSLSDWQHSWSPWFNLPISVKSWQNRKRAGK